MKKVAAIVLVIAICSSILLAFPASVLAFDWKVVTQDSMGAPGRFITEATAVAQYRNALRFTAEVRKVYIYTVFANAWIEGFIAVYPKTLPTVYRFVDSWGGWDIPGLRNTVAYSNAKPIAALFNAKHVGMTVAGQLHAKSYSGYVAAGNGKAIASYSAHTLASFLANLVWTILTWIM